MCETLEQQKLGIFCNFDRLNFDRLIFPLFGFVSKNTRVQVSLPSAKPVQRAEPKCGAKTKSTQAN